MNEPSLLIPSFYSNTMTMDCMDVDYIHWKEFPIDWNTSRRRVQLCSKVPQKVDTDQFILKNRLHFFYLNKLCNFSFYIRFIFKFCCFGFVYVCFNDFSADDLCETKNLARSYRKIYLQSYICTCWSVAFRNSRNLKQVVTWKIAPPCVWWWLCVHRFRWLVMMES